MVDGSPQTTWAILVAAGTGERLGGDRPKSFAALAGRPLLAESVERLDASDWIDAIVVTGGATRAESVRNALAEVPDEALVILVHDAARPLVDDAVIERLLGRLDGTVEGVVPGVEVRDTVKRVERGLVAETVERDGLVAAQTPQAFLADRLRAAFTGDLADATDCASLVERHGGRIAVVEG